MGSLARQQDAMSLIVQGEKPTDPVSLVDPDTGEVVKLEDASPQLKAAVLGRIQLQLEEARTNLSLAKRWLGRSIIDGMDSDGEWTVHARGVKVSAPSPVAKQYVWDGEMLHSILEGLVEAGVITRAASLRACKINVEHVPVLGGINKLLKVESVAEQILPARRLNEHKSDRSVRVEIDPGEL